MADDNDTNQPVPGVNPPLSEQPPPAPPAPAAPERPAPQFQSHTSQIIAGQQALGEREEDIYRRRERELDPLIAGAERTASRPSPKAPQLQKQGGFQSPGTEAMWNWAMAASALAAIGGAFARVPATTALEGIAGMNKGLAEGNIENYNRSYKQWEANAKAVKENNETKMQEYKMVMESNKHDMDQKLAMIELVSNKYRDELAGQAARQKNFTRLAEIMEKGDETQNRFNVEMERVKKSNDDMHRRAMQKGSKEWFDWYKTLTPEEQKEYQTSMQTGAAGRAEQAAEQKRERAKDIMDAVVEGKQKPVFTGMYGDTPYIRQEAANRGVNLADMEQEWNRANLEIKTMNSSQQKRFRDGMRSVVNTMNDALELGEQLQLSGVRPLNKAKLIWLTQYRANTPEGELASAYLSAVTAIKDEFVTAINGGYAPTEAAWTQANKQIDEEFGIGQLNASLTELRRVLNFRLQAASEYDENRYIPGSGHPGDRPEGAAPPALGAPVGSAPLGQGSTPLPSAAAVPAPPAGFTVQ